MLWMTHGLDDAQVFDLMGFEPSYWNKVNIHIGGTYGDKAAAMQRFAECAPFLAAPLLSLHSNHDFLEHHC